MRRLLGLLLVGLVFVPQAQAKLNPAFSERVAEPGDVIELHLGEESEQFLGPLRIYLVPLGAADDLRGEDDPRLIRIGELGKPEAFGTPSTLRFQVPDVAAGEYTAAIWFKGYATGTWGNALEGIHPLLTIHSGEASAVATTPEHGSGPPLWAVAVAAGALVASVGAWLWRRAPRRPATRASLR
jgi:hypothetical protein